MPAKIDQKLEALIKNDDAVGLSAMISNGLELNCDSLQLALESAMKVGAETMFNRLLEWGLAKNIIEAEYGSDTIPGLEIAIKAGHVDVLLNSLCNGPLQIEQWNDLMTTALATKNEQTVCDVLDLYYTYGVGAGDAHLDELDIAALKAFAEEEKYMRLKSLLSEYFEDTEEEND